MLMTRLEMRIIGPTAVLMTDNQKAAQQDNRQRFCDTRARLAREKFTRESNLTTAPKHRLCSCGCGLVLLWANPGYHPTPEDLEPEDATGNSEARVDTYPQAVSQAQVYWARGQLARVRRGEKVQMSVEALEALANTPMEGLPERVSHQKKPAKPMAKPGKARKTVNKK
jgi:hypothetical protein